MWIIKRSWTDNTELSYEEEVMLANILCQHCAGVESIEYATSIVAAIVEDIYRKIGKVTGEGILPIYTDGPNVKLFIVEIDNQIICGVIVDDKPIKIVLDRSYPVYYTYTLDREGALCDIEEDN